VRSSKQGARHPTTAECDTCERRFLQVCARKVGSFDYDINESKAAKIGADERRMQKARLLDGHLGQVGVSEVTLDGQPIEIGVLGESKVGMRR
jgi:hypothetical protein